MGGFYETHLLCWEPTVMTRDLVVIDRRPSPIIAGFWGEEKTDGRYSFKVWRNHSNSGEPFTALPDCPPDEQGIASSRGQARNAALTWAKEQYGPGAVQMLRQSWAEML